MAKDKSDRATIDLLNPRSHGGYRPGSGRKKGDLDKIKLGWSVTKEAKENLERLSKGKDYTPSELLNHLMISATTAPKKINNGQN